MKCPQCHSNNPSDSRFCRKCAAPLPAEEGEPDVRTSTLRSLSISLSRGDVFAGRYEVIEELGRGGMGKVYKVFDRKLGEDIALKQIKLEVAEDEKNIERFRNEIKFARKIAHRNVCRMYDMGEADGIHFITMEYIPGEDLRCLIRRIGQFTVGKTIYIARQICDGLAEAHRLGVVHRDMKPQNIMIDQDGNARIMDFGIARFHRVQGVTDTGVLIGTPEYMSPEQVEGIEVDRRSDIYSVGVILYEMLTGRVPFDGSTPISIAVKQKNQIPREPRELNTQIPEQLNELILKCMEKKRERRYQKAEDVHHDLKLIEDELPTTDRIIPARKPITSREITLKFSVRKLIFPLLAVLVAVLTVVAVRQFKLLEKPPSALSSTDEPQVRQEDPFKEGMMLFRQEDFSTALERFQAALALKPDHFEARMHAGLCFRNLQQPEPAVRELEEAMRLNNLDPRPYLHLAEIYEENEELDKAVFYQDGYLDRTPPGEIFTAAAEKQASLRERLKLSGDAGTSGLEEKPSQDNPPGLAPSKKAEPLPPVDAAVKEPPPIPKPTKPVVDRIPDPEKPAEEKQVPDKKKDAVRIEAPMRIRISRDNAPARLEPKPDAAVIHEFPLGIVLTVKRSEGAWFGVGVPDELTGREVLAYVQNLDVEGISGEDEAMTAEGAEAEAGLKIKVINDHATLRESPEAEGRIIRKLPLGLVLTQQSRSGEWIAVNLGPDAPEGIRVGYVHRRDVEVQERIQR